MQQSKVFAQNLGHTPEGPAFDRQGNLFTVNAHGQEIYRITPSGQVSLFVKTEGSPNGLAFDNKGDLFVAEAGMRAIVRITPEGKVFNFADSYEGKRLNAPNDLVFDEYGNLYFTDPIRYPMPDPAYSPVHKVMPDGKVSLVYEGFAFPNGIGISPDGKTLYVAETRRCCITQLEIRRDGIYGKPRQLAYLGDNFRPDGMALDEEGNIVQAIFPNGKLLVVSPSGKIVDVLESGGTCCTNVCFGGRESNTLYVTVVTTNSVNTLSYPRRGMRLFSGQQHHL